MGRTPRHIIIASVILRPIELIKAELSQWNEGGRSQPKENWRLHGSRFRGLRSLHCFGFKLDIFAIGFFAGELVFFIDLV